MKKQEFKKMVKEIIKEVISEMEVPDEQTPGEETPMDDMPPTEMSADDAVNALSEPTGGEDDVDFGTPTSASDKRWRGKMRWREKNIEQDPVLQAKLAASRAADDRSDWRRSLKK